MQEPPLGSTDRYLETFFESLYPDNPINVDRKKFTEQGFAITGDTDNDEQQAANGAKDQEGPREGGTAAEEEEEELSSEAAADLEKKKLEEKRVMQDVDVTKEVQFFLV